MQKSKAGAVLLLCLLAGEAYGDDSKHDLFHSAYCIGAISESRHRTGDACERLLGADTSDVAVCDELQSYEDETRLERLLRHVRIIRRHPLKGDAAIAKDLRSLAAMGQAHIRSGELSETAFHDRCLRDCLNWPPTEGCVERAQ